MAVVSGSRASASAAAASPRATTAIAVGSLVAVVVSAAIFVGYRRHRRHRRQQQRQASAPTVALPCSPTTATPTSTTPPTPTAISTPTAFTVPTTTTALASCDSVHALQSPWKLTAPDAPDAPDASALDATSSNDCTCCASPRPTDVKITRRLSISIPDVDSDAVAAAVQRRKLSIAIPDPHDSDAETHSLASPTSSVVSDASDDHDDRFSLSAVDHKPMTQPLDKVPSMREQSPIDIHEHESEIVPMASCSNAVTIAMGEGHADLMTNDHGFSVQWTQPGTNALVVGDKVYHAVQFHLHTPSEHTLDGVHEELELHMVHQAADGSLAVLGILFREGATNSFLAQFWDALADVKPGQTRCVSLDPLDPEALDVQSRSVFRYRGSLTTPPYTEGVEWVVVHDVLEASRAQLDVFHNALPGTNARDLQPLNERHVWLAC